MRFRTLPIVAAVVGATSLVGAAPPVPTTTIVSPQPQRALPSGAALQASVAKIQLVHPPLPTTKYLARDTTVSNVPARTPMTPPVVKNPPSAVLGRFSRVTFTGSFLTSNYITMGVDLQTPAPFTGAYVSVWNHNEQMFLFSQQDASGVWSDPIASFDDYSLVIKVPPGASHADVRLSRLPWGFNLPYSNQSFAPGVTVKDAAGSHDYDAGPNLPELYEWARQPSSVVITPSPDDLQATNLWTVVQEKIHVTATYPVTATGRGLCFQWPWIFENYHEAFVAAGAVTPNPIFESINDPANKYLFRFDAGPPGWCATVGADNTAQYDLAIRRLPQNANIDTTEDFMVWDHVVQQYQNSFPMAYHARKVTSVSCVHTMAGGPIAIPGPSVTCTATLEQPAPRTGYKVYGLLLNGQTVPPFMFAAGATVSAVTLPNAGMTCGGPVWDTRLVAPKDRETSGAMMTTMPTITEIMKATALSCR